MKKSRIKHRFVWNPKTVSYDGYALVQKNLIVVHTVTPELNFFKISQHPMAINYFLSVVFHEMGHILSYRNGKYREYNRGLDTNKITPKKFKIWASQALKAERLADKIGKQLMKKHFPKLNYMASYDGEGGKATINTLIMHAEIACGLCNND